MREMNRTDEQVVSEFVSALLAWPGAASLTIRPMLPEDGDELQELLEQCSDYSEITFGLPPGAADGQSLYLSGLELVTEGQKILIGLSSNSVLVGVLDVLVGYPAEKIISL